MHFVNGVLNGNCRDAGVKCPQRHTVRRNSFAKHVRSYTNSNENCFLPAKEFRMCTVAEGIRRCFGSSTSKHKYMHTQKFPGRLLQLGHRNGKFWTLKVFVSIACKIHNSWTQDHANVRLQARLHFLPDIQFTDKAHFAWNSIWNTIHTVVHMEIHVIANTDFSQRVLIVYFIFCWPCIPV